MSPYVIMLVIVCVLSWGLRSVVQRVALHHMSPLMTAVIGMYVYSAVAPLLYLYGKARGSISEWNAPGVAWSSLVGVLSAIAWVSFVHAIEKAPVHLVVGLTSMHPVLTFVLCTIFLGEPVTLQKTIGIAVMSLGIALLTL